MPRMRMGLKGDIAFLAAMQKLPEEVRKEVEVKAIEKVAAMLVDDLSAASPRRTSGGPKGKEKRRPGSLARSWRWQRGKGNAGASVVAVGTNDDGWYWRLVEFGTKPHTLRRKSVNWFFGGSRGRRRRQVFMGPDAHSTVGGFHPGTPPRPFVRPTIKRWRTKARKEFKVALETSVGLAMRSLRTRKAK